MDTSQQLGYCLVSQQIRDKIVKGEINVTSSDLSRSKKGFFNDLGLEKRVQPSSFEPIVGNEAFILDVEQHVVFGPGHNQTVYRALLELPRRQRQRVELDNGFELKTGFSYLIPLEEKIVLSVEERIRSSPKSSMGRLFPLTRMVADHGRSFDEVYYSENNPIQLWLLVQPTAFNLILHPGLTLNQLRFFYGLNVSLTQEEVVKEFNEEALLYRRKSNGRLIPAKPIISDDGLHINLDLKGEHTEGIVALRARRNPNPIDLSKVNFYDAEDFFEPVEGSHGKVILKGGERYLLASQGVLSIPAHLSAELRRHYKGGIRGTWDEAGFIDNGFMGDLVFEAVFSETGGIKLESTNERPASVLELFRTSELPDKIYGSGIGSNYYGQLGPRVSKHFRTFDYKNAARHYGKLNRDVVVQDTKILRDFRSSSEGFEPIGQELAKRLIRKIEIEGFFHSRYDCEGDEEVLQAVPYVLIFGPNNTIATYIRATKIEDYGDRRLFGKHSFGWGGHINREDHPDLVRKCIERELKEEARINGRLSKPRFVGTLIASDEPVNRVHFGMIYTTHVDGEVVGNESSLTFTGMKRFEELDKDRPLFETWSRVLIPYLPLLYKK